MATTPGITARAVAALDFWRMSRPNEADRAEDGEHLVSDLCTDLVMSLPEGDRMMIVERIRRDVEEETRGER